MIRVFGLIRVVGGLTAGPGLWGTGLRGSWLSGWPLH